VALALAGCAALSLILGDAIGFGSPGAEAVSTPLWILGWVLLAWATIVGAAASVLLIRAAALRRRPALIEAALIVATVVVIAGVIWSHPLAGTGTGVGQ
jgi:hypothetical protein